MSASTFNPRRLLWPLVFAGTTALASSGCEIAIIIAATADDDDDGECWDACDCYGECWTDDGVTPPPTGTAPTISIDLPDWPPIGPDGEVEVSATATSGSLTDAEFFFRNSVRKSFGTTSTTTGTVFAFGDELGEGYGTLAVEVNVSTGAGARKEVTNLLVDLTQPEVYTDDIVLPAQNGELYFWIADAWVVSGYELVVGGEVFSETLEPGYPSTLGVEWDYSLVSIPVEEFPVGVHAGEIRVWDAAGNEGLFDFPLTIDGLPPEASVDQPTDGASVSGTFPVTVSGLDDLPGAVSLEIRVGGALVATGLGPSATVVLDANEFPAGLIDISALAVDAAGNQSAPSVRTVTVVHP